jgi:hypothetical protein
VGERLVGPPAAAPAPGQRGDRGSAGVDAARDGQTDRHASLAARLAAASAAAAAAEPPGTVLLTLARADWEERIPAIESPHWSCPPGTTVSQLQKVCPKVGVESPHCDRVPKLDLPARHHQKGRGRRQADRQTDRESPTRAPSV